MDNRNNNQFTAEFGSLPNPRRQSRQHYDADAYLNEEILLVYDFFIEYNNNMRSYQNNVTSFLQTINAMHTARTGQRSRNGFSNTTQTNRPNVIPRQNTNFINDTINHILPGLFADIVVHPTEQQIANATRTFVYTHNIDMSLNTQCPITLEEFVPNETVCQIKHCRHTFKDASIKNWFRRNVRCPVCRYDIRTYAVEPSVVDLSNNTNSPVNTLPIINRNNNVVQTISSGISSILQNYFENGNVTDSSLNHAYSFEIPIVFYMDASGEDNIDIDNQVD